MRPVHVVPFKKEKRRLVQGTHAAASTASVHKMPFVEVSQGLLWETRVVRGAICQILVVFSESSTLAKILDLSPAPHAL